MSRLTGSPFHKPSPFEFPRGPPSPPETLDTIVGPGHILAPSQSFAAQDFGSMDAGHMGATPDTPLRGKRSSSIPYHSTSFRETKERAVQRNNRSLIIVIPTSTLVQEHGRTASNGPYHRLSEGVVMPLFPTIFGQLTAIAREFNFPSTLGLCLYFYYVEAGLTLKPRITDDSWQSLWAHLSDPVLPNERRPLIGGKVEFDIDLRLARWYPTWVSSVHREFSEHAAHSAHLSSAASVAHFRAESSLLGARPYEDDLNESSANLQQHATPIGRHVPRKLSLVERFDVASIRSDSKPNPRSGAPTEIAVGSQTLSTIFQEDEPKSGRQQLDNRVNSWRASALISPTPLAAKGQTSLDPPNLPNNIPIDTPADVPASPANETEIMNLADFTWSVTSAGPQSCGELSPISWAHPPSVHLAHRLQGSVCTSPATCTSFGPDDDDNFSYASTQYRVPSVHLAERLQGSVCTSPSTCTSFGPDDDDIISYMLDSPRILTPDLAHRFFENCPLTPMTATSWGAPLSYPPSPRCDSPTPSVDLGERSRFCDEFETSLYYPRSQGDVPPMSLSENTGGRPWVHVWPFSSGPRNSIVQPESQSLTMSSVQHAAPWSHVWPYNSGLHKTVADAEPNTKTTSSVSSATPWAHVWPYNSSVLEMSAEDSRQKGLPASLPGIRSGSPWPHVWPYNAMLLAPAFSPQELATDVITSFGYPYMDLYRPIYPHLEIYPTVPGGGLVLTKSTDQSKDEVSSIVVKFPVSYPTMEIYQAVYPYNLTSIYPDVTQLEKRNVPEAMSHGEYPFFNIYPAINPPYFSHFSLHTCNPRSQYPDFDIYPDLSSNSSASAATKSIHDEDFFELSVHVRAYPVFNLYPAVYPHFDIYPAVESYPHDLKHTSQLLMDDLEEPLRTTLQGIYPLFNLYPAVYPYFDIYPSVVDTEGGTNENAKKSSLSPILASIYPIFNLYPDVYPYFNIYPAHPGVTGPTSVEKEWKKSLSPTLPSTYPSFNLYPDVYPYFNIYPAPQGVTVPTAAEKENVWKKSLSPMLPSTYPSFNLYVYPYFNIYPAPHRVTVPTVVEKEDACETSLSSTLPPMYPSFNLYPSMYPYLEIYPAPYGEAVDDTKSQNNENQPIPGLSMNYPYFSLYPGVYPYLDIYPCPYWDSFQISASKPAINPTHDSNMYHHLPYPYFNLYPAVYPYFDLYLPRPASALEPPKKKSKPSSRLTHLELHAMVMMERAASGRSFGLKEALSDFSLTDSQMLSIHKDETIAHYMQETAAANAARNIQIYTVPIPARDPRKTLPAYNSGSAIFLPGPTNGTRTEPPLLRKSFNLRGPSVSRSSSLREPITKPPIPPKPSTMTTRRRDSLVLQRVKAFDHSGESSTGISKETLARFPMPPRSFPPLPPLPQDRGH